MNLKKSIFLISMVLLLAINAAALGAKVMPRDATEDWNTMALFSESADFNVNLLNFSARSVVLYVADTGRSNIIYKCQLNECDGSDRELYSTSYDITELDSDERHIIWKESNADGTEYALFAMTKEPDPTITQITPWTTDLASVNAKTKINNNRVLFSTYNQGSATVSVYLCSLNEGSTHYCNGELSNYALLDSYLTMYISPSLDIYSNRAVWSHRGEVYVWVCDLNASNECGSLSAVLVNSFTGNLELNSTGFTWTMSNRDLYFYDINSATKTVLNPATAGRSFKVINANDKFIGWVNYNYLSTPLKGYLEGKTELHGYEQITSEDNTFESPISMDESTRILWLKDTGTEYKQVAVTWRN